MSDLRQAAQQALDALNHVWNITSYDDVVVDKAATALETALEAPQPEPVAWLRVIDEAMVTHHLGVADPTDDYETAKRKMNNLLSHAQDIGAYFAAPPQRQPEPVAWRPSWCRDVLQSGCGWFFGAPTKADIEYQRKHGSKIDYAYAHLAPADPPQRQPLSDVDILQGWKSANKVMGVPTDQVVLTFARWLEAMHEIGGDK